MSTSQCSKVAEESLILNSTSSESNICRLCDSKDASIPLFDVKTQPLLIDKIHEISGVWLLENCQYSNYICEKCHELILTFIKFREICQRKKGELTNAVVIKKEQVECDIKYEKPPPIIDDSSDHWNDEDMLPICEPITEKKAKSPKKFVCVSCKKKFTNSTSYANHLPCSYKKTKLKKPKKLKREKVQKVAIKKRVINDAEERFPTLCDVCGRKFTRKQTLERHLATHNNVFPYTCDLCPYRGRDPQLLNIHKRSHMPDSEKPYKCTQCPKATTTASNLAKHVLRSHSTNKPFECDSCSKCFKCKVDLKRHIMTVHQNLLTAQCDICFKTLNKKHMNKHRLRVHKVRSERVLPSRLPSYILCKLNQNTSAENSAM